MPLDLIWFVAIVTAFVIFAGICIGRIIGRASEPRTLSGGLPQREREANKQLALAITTA